MLWPVGLSQISALCLGFLICGDTAHQDAVVAISYSARMGERTHGREWFRLRYFPLDRHRETLLMKLNIAKVSRRNLLQE